MDQINLLVLFVPTVQVPGSSRAQGSRRLKLSAEMLSYFMGLIPTKMTLGGSYFFRKKKQTKPFRAQKRPEPFL